MKKKKNCKRFGEWCGNWWQLMIGALCGTTVRSNHDNKIISGASLRPIN